MENHTHRMATMTLERERLAGDISRMNDFTFSNPYGEFIFGKATYCYLWNERGTVDDPFLSGNDCAARITEYGRRLTYLSDLISRTFNVARLRFARLAKLQPHSIIIPHRDYIELSTVLRRVHVPLKTDSEIFFGEMKTVFRMQPGEVWFLDASRLHSVASFSDQERIHLILDFAPGANDDELFLDPSMRVGQGIPEQNIVHRTQLSKSEGDAFLALSHVIDRSNFKDILAILVRRFYRRDFSLDRVYGILLEIAHRSGDREVIDKVSEFVDYFIKERDNRWSPENETKPKNSNSSVRPAAA
jgi:hypothetical protein